MTQANQYYSQTRELIDRTIVNLNQLYKYNIYLKSDVIKNIEFAEEFLKKVSTNDASQLTEEDNTNLVSASVMIEDAMDFLSDKS